MQAPETSRVRERLERYPADVASQAVATEGTKLLDALQIASGNPVLACSRWL